MGAEEVADFLRCRGVNFIAFGARSRIVVAFPSGWGLPGMATQANAEISHHEPFFSARRDLDLAEQRRCAAPSHQGVSIARYRRDRPGSWITTPNAPMNQFMAVANLRPMTAHGRWRENRHIYVPSRASGAIACLDLRERWTVDLPHAFDTFNIYVPQKAFDDLTDELECPRLHSLHCPDDREIYDQTMHGLALAALPLLSDKCGASALTIEHIASAFLAHLAITYGGVKVARRKAQSDLAGWQERRAKEVMLRDLREDVVAQELADACGLSVRHFQRAFQRLTGMPPHRWRTNERVEHAKRLIEQNQHSLLEIALACGFSDQSHFSRVFGKVVGCSPNAYRRVQRM
jgi:AraC family transcriptional regulator